MHSNIYIEEAIHFALYGKMDRACQLVQKHKFDPYCADHGYLFRSSIRQKNASALATLIDLMPQESLQENFHLLGLLRVILENQSQECMRVLIDKDMLISPVAKKELDLCIQDGRTLKNARHSHEIVRWFLITMGEMVEALINAQRDSGVNVAGRTINKSRDLVQLAIEQLVISFKQVDPNLSILTKKFKDNNSRLRKKGQFNPVVEEQIKDLFVIIDKSVLQSIALPNQSKAKYSTQRI